ncbi:MAG: FecR domain-containing protein [Holophagales bacterium]|nr:FecR domain-containing protein [Holophagales bacterium]
MTTRTPWVALAIAFLLPATTAAAQREGYSYLSYVGAEVSLVSRAEDDSSARLNTPILAEDRISTGSTSRAEVVLADGNILRIDVQTNLRFDRLANTYEAEDDRNSIFLERGAVSLEHRAVDLPRPGDAHRHRRRHGRLPR